MRERPERGGVPPRGWPGAQAETFVFVYIGASVFLQTAAWGKGLTGSFLVCSLTLRPRCVVLAYSAHARHVFSCPLSSLYVA